MSSTNFPFFATFFKKNHRSQSRFSKGISRSCQAKINARQRKYLDDRRPACHNAKRERSEASSKQRVQQKHSVPNVLRSETEPRTTRGYGERTEAASNARLSRRADACNCSNSGERSIHCNAVKRSEAQFTMRRFGNAGSVHAREAERSESDEERERNANARSRLRCGDRLKANCVRSRSLTQPLASELLAVPLHCLRCGSSSEKRSGMRGGFGVGAGGERELCARSRRGDCRDTPCLRGARGREGGRARKSRRHYGVYGVLPCGA